MGLPSRSAVRTRDITIEGLELRFKAYLGDGKVFVSRSGSDLPPTAEVDLPLAVEVDRIGTSIRHPRIAVIDPDMIPGLLEAAEAVQAAAVEFYRHPDTYEPAADTTPAAVTIGSA